MQYCSSCLSCDRRLLPLKELQPIITIMRILHLKLDLENDLICWECGALLAKIDRFRAQAMQAKKMLTVWPQNTNKKMKSLSKLVITVSDPHDTIYFNSTDRMAEEDPLEEYNIDIDSNQVKDIDDDVIDDWDDDEQSIYIIDVGQDEDELCMKKKNTGDIVENVEQYEEQEEEEESFQDNLSKNEESLEENDNLDILCKPSTNEINKEKEIDNKNSFTKLCKDEEHFIIGRMTLVELYKSRDLDRNAPVYKRSPYKCIKCILGFYRKDNFEKHMKQKHKQEFEGKQRTNVCPICDTRFARVPTLTGHYERHFKKYKCRVCSFEHHKLATMLVHKLKNHREGQVFSCDACEKTFDRPRSLRYHRESHKEKPTCDICGKTSSTKYGMKIHMMVHTGARRVQCPQCNLSVRHSGLAAHVRRHGPRDEGAYCPECDMQFASPHEYRRHLERSRVHAPKISDRYACTQCDAKFTEKFTLTRHVAVKHLKIYPFKCHVCDKGFSRNDRVQKHIMEKHEGISQPKDKICPFCHKGFKDKASLKRHVRVHTGERPYACACGAAFAQTSTRNAHARACRLKKSVA